MSDSLRDRIAGALGEFLRCDSKGWRNGGNEWINLTNMADTVIKELEITPQWVIPDVGEVNIHPHGGVSVTNIGNQLVMASSEARALAKALLEAAEANDAQ